MCKCCVFNCIATAKNSTSYDHCLCNQEILNTNNRTKTTCLTFTLMSHLDPPCSYALTRQEADHLKISSTYRTARLNIQTVTDPNYPASPETEGREVSSLVLSFEDATEPFSLLLACRMSLKFALVILSKCAAGTCRFEDRHKRNETNHCRWEPSFKVVAFLSRYPYSHRFQMTLRQVKSWQRMQSHPSVVNIQGFEVKESESNPEGDSISHLRLISDSPNYTITEYLATFPHVHRSKLVSTRLCLCGHYLFNSLNSASILPRDSIIFIATRSYTVLFDQWAESACNSASSSHKIVSDSPIFSWNPTARHA